MTATLPPTVLPRAAALTDAALAPAAPSISTADRAALAERLHHRLSRLTPGPAGRGVRVDAFALRSGAPPFRLIPGPESPPVSSSPRGSRARQSPGAPPAAEPFRWSPRTARRILGLDAARSCLTRGGSSRSPAPSRMPAPAEAVAEVVARAVVDGRRDRRPPGSLAHWLARTTPGGRAAVQGDAVTWATQFLTALEWDRFDQVPEVGGPDHWWDWSGPPRVALRGRADVRATTAAGPGGRTPAPVLLTVMDGWPGPTSRTELGLAALVDALGPRDQPAPARVMGWWPECGRALVLAPDRAALEQVVDAVVAVVAGRLGGPPGSA